MRLIIKKVIFLKIIYIFMFVYHKEYILEKPDIFLWRKIRGQIPIKVVYEDSIMSTKIKIGQP